MINLKPNYCILYKLFIILQFFQNSSINVILNHYNYIIFTFNNVLINTLNAKLLQLS